MLSCVNGSACSPRRTVRAYTLDNVEYVGIKLFLIAFNVLVGRNPIVSFPPFLFRSPYSSIPFLHLCYPTQTGRLTVLCRLFPS